MQGSATELTDCADSTIAAKDKEPYTQYSAKLSGGASPQSAFKNDDKIVDWSLIGEEQDDGNKDISYVYLKAKYGTLIKVKKEISQQIGLVNKDKEPKKTKNIYTLTCTKPSNSFQRPEKVSPTNAQTWSFSQKCTSDDFENADDWPIYEEWEKEINDGYDPHQAAKNLNGLYGWDGYLLIGYSKSGKSGTGADLSAYELKPKLGKTVHGRIFVGYNKKSGDISVSCTKKHAQNPDYKGMVDRVYTAVNKARFVKYGDYQYGDYQYGDYDAASTSYMNNYYDYNHGYNYALDTNQSMITSQALITIIAFLLCCILSGMFCYVFGFIFSLFAGFVGTKAKEITADENKNYML